MTQPPALPAMAFQESLEMYSSARDEIAATCAALVPSQSTLVIDAGATAFLVARHLATREGGVSGPREVFTNNFGAAFTLASTPIACRMIGGKVDDIHFCNVVSDYDLRNLVDMLDGRPFHYLCTGAAYALVHGRLSIRARRPDQFEFKNAMISAAAHVILPLEAEKLVDPFDGTFSFPFERKDASVVTNANQSLVTALQNAVGSIVRVAD